MILVRLSLSSDWSFWEAFEIGCIFEDWMIVICSFWYFVSNYKLYSKVIFAFLYSFRVSAAGSLDCISWLYSSVVRNITVPLCFARSGNNNCVSHRFDTDLIHWHLKFGSWSSGLLYWQPNSKHWLDRFQTRFKMLEILEKLDQNDLIHTTISFHNLHWRYSSYSNWNSLYEKMHAVSQFYNFLIGLKKTIYSDTITLSTYNLQTIPNFSSRRTSIIPITIQHSQLRTILTNQLQNLIIHSPHKSSI